MNSTIKNVAAAVLVAPAVLMSTSNDAPAQTVKGVKNIVLVHGAFADGSSWAKVIPILQAKGLNVIAVQNPLTSFDDDVAATKRVLGQLDGSPDPGRLAAGAGR